jgi:hypothetical protein
MAALAAVLKPDQADASAPAQEQFDSIKLHLCSAQAKNWPVNDVEEFLEVDGREIMRALSRGFSINRVPAASPSQSLMRMDNRIRISVCRPVRSGRSLAS